MVVLFCYRFDGEMVEYEDTPDDLDLEGGEILDLFILKS